MPDEKEAKSCPFLCPTCERGNLNFVGVERRCDKCGSTGFFGKDEFRYTSHDLQATREQGAREMKEAATRVSRDIAYDSLLLPSTVCSVGSPADFKKALRGAFVRGAKAVQKEIVCINPAIYEISAIHEVNPELLADEEKP